ncbi:MAG: hypothetical protein AAF636_04005 [Pseudomonadota bacterium]
MQFPLSKKQRRQLAYQKRARRAFLLARWMIPAVLLGISAAAWSDPVLGPRLQSGLDEIKPMIEAVQDGEPVMEVLAGAFGRPSAPTLHEEDIARDEDARRVAVDGLPVSAVPVNRPTPETPVVE